MKTKKLFLWSVVGLTVAAVAYRLFFFFFALKHIPFTWDEGWPSLMALHILKGEFPVVYWGQTYMGTQESYFQAVCIALLGAKTWVVRLYPLLFGFLYVLASVRLAARIYGRVAGLITLALMTVPVSYIMIGTVLIPPDNYLPTTALGSFSLLMTYDLAFGEMDVRRRIRKTFWLGLLLGYTFWLHILSLSYIGVAALFLFLRNKLIFIRREGWAGVGGFVIGALPFLVYNIANSFATFRDVGGTTSWAKSWLLLQVLFQHTLHFLVGIKIAYFGDNANYLSLPFGLALAVGGVWILGLVTVLVVPWRSYRGLWRLSLQNVHGTVMLVVMFAAAVFLFCRGDRSASQNVRYVLPAVSVLPVLLAGGLAWIGRRSKVMGLLLVAVAVAGQMWGNVLLLSLWSDPVIVARDIHLPVTTPVRDFLKQRGIHRAYANYWLAYRVTFETGEDIICAEPYNQRFPGRPVKFLDQVQAATNVAYVYATARTRDFSAEEFEGVMRQIGGRYVKSNVGDFTVFHGFEPPYAVPGACWHELPRQDWKISASDGTNIAGLMMDGKVETRWCSGTKQVPGMRVTVDMGSTQVVGRVRLDLGWWATDFPRGYRIQVSRDGWQWQTMADTGPIRWNVFWRENHPVFLSRKGDYILLDLPPAAARYVRLELAGGSRRFDWSIAELRMFTPVLP